MLININKCSNHRFGESAPVGLLNKWLQPHTDLWSYLKIAGSVLCSSDVSLVWCQGAVD